MNNVSTVKTEYTNKFVVIGKMWLKSQDGTRPGCIRMSKFMPSNIILKPGDTLSFFRNDKREGHQDADLNVCIKLPNAEATAFIAAEKAARVAVNV
jgi:plastocyanin